MPGEPPEDFEAIDHGVDPLAEAFELGSVEEDEGEELAEDVGAANVENLRKDGWIAI